MSLRVPPNLLTPSELASGVVYAHELTPERVQEVRAAMKAGATLVPAEPDYGVCVG
jgi:hypothetical protein